LILQGIGAPSFTDLQCESDAAAPVARAKPESTNSRLFATAVGYSILMADESLIGVYEVLKRHEETLRDLVVEVRLLYHNLPDKEKQRLEWSRARTTEEVGVTFASNIRLLEDAIARLRANH